MTATEKLADACRAWVRYFDDLDRVTDADDPMSIARKKFHSERMANCRESIAAYDSELALINRTPSEAAKAAESEIIQRSDELADAIADGLPAGEIASIIQRHTPPVNERLFDALADLTDMLTNPLREGFALVNPESLLPIQEARKAIAEARAALEEK